MEQRLTDSKYIDLSYEEISPDRNIQDSNWANGLQNFRFSVAPTGGGCVIPHMSYMLVEYNFGSSLFKQDNYTATQALFQSQKIALQNNWVSCLYNACRFTVAQSEISVVNSNHAQLHTLKQRMGYTTSFMEHLGGDLNAFDPDFSRRLARSCQDGVNHRDGLIDCSPYLSSALGPFNRGNIDLFFQNENELTRDATDSFYNGTTSSGAVAPVATIYPFMSRSRAFNITSGSGEEIKTTDVDLSSAIVNSIQWTLPAFSLTPGTDAQNAVVIDGTVFQQGDFITFYFGNTNASALQLNNIEFRVGNIKSNGSQVILQMVAFEPIVANVVIAAFGTVSPLVGSGINKAIREGANPYNQADPRANTVNGVVAYQPPLAFFEITDPSVFYGDMEIQMTPNSNWQQACIESAVPGTYYNTDVKHGTDFCFGIKSVRLYLARARLLTTPPERSLLTIKDYQVSNKQLPNGSSTINFNIPPSTNTIVCWIQDSAAGTNSKLPLTRFKARQYTGDQKLNRLNQYGPWAHDFSENLSQIQLNFAGITKPVTNFQRGGAGSALSPTTNSMLQRWIMSNQNNNNRQESEKYTDWLTMGAYYVFDFTRSADNLGTYLTVNITYNGDQPTDGNGPTSTTPSNVNLYICSIYERDIALTYGQYGNVVSAQTQMR